MNVCSCISVSEENDNSERSLTSFYQSVCNFHINLFICITIFFSNFLLSCSESTWKQDDYEVKTINIFRI